jgi:hypothetical protein
MRQLCIFLYLQSTFEEKFSQNKENYLNFGQTHMVNLYLVFEIKEK